MTPKGTLHLFKRVLQSDGVLCQINTYPPHLPESQEATYRPQARASWLGGWGDTLGQLFLLTPAGPQGGSPPTGSALLVSQAAATSGADVQPVQCSVRSSPHPNFLVPSRSPQAHVRVHVHPQSC